MIGAMPDEGIQRRRYPRYSTSLDATVYLATGAIEARLLMGLMAYKCQIGGFLYYNIANWPLARQHGPITSGPYTNWDPVTVENCDGDGSLTCAGPDGPLPTIRMENIRDGLEDYEYLWLLAERAARIDFALEYEFASRLLARALEPLFDQIADTMVDAFVRRAYLMREWVGSEVELTAAEGNGPVNALDHALRKALAMPLRGWRKLERSASRWGTRWGLAPK